MKWIIAIFALATTISAGDQNGDQEGAKSIAAMNTKLDDLTKQLSQQKQQLQQQQNEIEALPPYGMVETVFVGGTPGASSEWMEGFNDDYAADLAFKMNPGKGGGWRSGFDEDPPYYIWYDFKRPLRPAKISYLPYKPNGNGNLMNANAARVYSFSFIGTDDPVCAKNSNWTDLCLGESSNYHSLYDEFGCTVGSGAPWIRSVATKLKKGKFHCLGLKSLEPKTNAYVSLRGIRIWEMQWL